MLFRPDLAAAAGLDAWRALREGPDGIQHRQRIRLARMLRHARTWSRFYAQRYAGQPSRVEDVSALPAVTKRELMERFDDWVTDPGVSLAGATTFTGDPSRMGELYMGRYFACTTSGTTGRRAILVKDAYEVAALAGLRMARLAPVIGARAYAAFFAGGGRVGYAVATGGHFAGAAGVEYTRRRAPFLGLRVFPVQAPIESNVRGLLAMRPSMLMGYPTALRALADEAHAGRLTLHLDLALCAGERLTPSDRDAIEAAFSCRLLEVYAASEALGLAFPCDHGALHVNEDWYILEAVDEDHRPVAPGTPSHTTLVTNLANRVQPILRYDLGDSITLGDAPCPCGSPFATVRVEGRTDDVLDLAGARVLPLALSSVIEELPGVERFQAIQSAPDVLRIRLEASTGYARDEVWRRVEERLRSWLHGQGAHEVELELGDSPPTRDARSGKFRQVSRSLAAMHSVPR